MYLVINSWYFWFLPSNLKPHTVQAMKIEVAPWIRDYVCNMDDLYTELILEKVVNKPSGEESRKVDNYRDILSNQNNLSLKQAILNVTGNVEPGKRLLIKGEPGMGKTTLVKKIAWHWAKEFFKMVSLVVVVFLKLVRPGDVIGNIIIDQNSALQGLGMSHLDVECIFQIFGNSCLLILDGLNEHALGQNQDVVKIIKGQNLLHTHVLVTL